MLLRIRRLLALSALCIGLASGACGDGSGGGGGGASAQPVLPQVVNVGGSSLASPKVLPLLYASDAGATDILAFLQELAASSYWAQTTSEYGVGTADCASPHHAG